MLNWGSRMNKGYAQGADSMLKLERRAVLGAGAAAALLLLPGCATLGGSGASGAGNAADADALRRLLGLSTRRAFAQLGQPDGFWTSPVARIGLPVLFTRPGRKANAALRSKAFQEQLQHRLNQFAEQGAKVAEPIVEDAVRKLSFANPAALIADGPTGATTYLRRQMGPALVNAMIPALQTAMEQSQDPVLTKAMAGLSGVTLTDAAHALALGAENAIWYQIGAAEAQIRSNPSTVDDPALTAALRPR